MKLAKYIKYFIGSLIRDIVILGSSDFIEYKVEGNNLVYKSWIPFYISIGNYKFLPKK